MKVEPKDRNTFEVNGHVVDLELTECSCSDFQMRRKRKLAEANRIVMWPPEERNVCKHMIAVFAHLMNNALGMKNTDV